MRNKQGEPYHWFSSLISELASWAWEIRSEAKSLIVKIKLRACGKQSSWNSQDKDPAMREMEERIQTYEKDLPQIVNRVLIRAYFQRNCMMPRKEILKRSQNCVWYSHRTENLTHSHQPYWATQHSSTIGQRPQEFCLTHGNTQFQTDLPKIHKSKVQKHESNYKSLNYPPE